jgi:hypothetical protein
MTEILARVDVATQTPVVFFPHSVDKQHILAWMNGKETIVTLDYYHTTKPLSAADEEILRSRYAKATGDTAVFVRHRLPRVPRERPNMLAPAPKQAPAPTPAAAPAPAPANRATRRRKGQRHSAAMPIESQPLPTGEALTSVERKALETAAANHPAINDFQAALTAAGAQPANLPVVQATPNDVMVAIQEAQADFQKRMDAILQKLTPAEKV